MSDIKCRQCGRVLSPTEADGPCPQCGSVDREVVTAGLGGAPIVAPAMPSRPRRRYQWAVAAVVVIGLGVLASLVAWSMIADRRTASRLTEIEAAKAIELSADEAEAHLIRANAAAHEERRYDMLAECEKAIAANPRLVSAYLRAAEDLSPSDLERYRTLQEALAQTIDLRELKGGDFAFGALLTDLQRLASKRMGQSVTLYINFHSFPEEQRATLRDAKVNLNSIMDATGENLLRSITFKVILETLCRQVGATHWAGPEYIEIVCRATAVQEAAIQPRLRSYELIAPTDLHRREERLLQFEQALQQTIDLREFKGGDFALGALLTDLQRLVTTRMRVDVPLYINYPSFQPETRATMRDSKVHLNGLMDASGENLLPAVKVGTILGTLLRDAGEPARFQATPDYIEIVSARQPEEKDATWWPLRRARSSEPASRDQFTIKFGPPRRNRNALNDANDETDMQPLRVQAKPRPEAIRWLTNGIERVPESAELYLARGEVYLEQYDLTAAIADFSRAIERNPADRRAYRQRSIAYAARGQPGDAALARADALATRP